MEQMDKKTEQRLISATMDALRFSSEGLPPTDAVIKAAQTHELDRPKAERVLEAYNIALVRQHQKSASGMDRAAVFPLAIPDAVMDKLYPATLPQPAEKKAEEFVPFNMYRPEGKVFNPYYTRPAKTDTTAQLAQQCEFAVKRAFDEVRHAKAEMLGLRADTLARRSEFMYECERLSELLTNSYSPTMATVEKSASDKYAKAVLAYTKPMVNKTPSLPEASVSWQITARIKAAADKLGKYIATMDKLNEAADSFFNYQELLKDTTEQIEKAGGVRELMTTTVGNILANEFSNSPSQATQDAYKKELFGGELEKERKMIRSRMMLREMLEKDDILRRANPQQMIQAYNELVSVAPDAMDKPAVVRPVLRRVAELGIVDPIELAQLVKIDKTIAPGSTGKPDLSGDPASDFEKYRAVMML